MDIISRKEALKQGLKIYFTGMPCKYGHICEKYVSGWQCVQCCKESCKTEEYKEYRKDYRKTEEYKNGQKEYSKTEKYKEYQKDYQKEYSKTEKFKNYRKEWRRANPDKCALSAADRGHMLRKATPKWANPDETNQIYKERDRLNKELNLKGNDRFEVDHIFPINPRNKSVRGLHCIENLRLITKSENCSKKDNYEQDW